MPQTQEQNIEVRAGTLNNLIADVESGRYRIPQFQREFVWEKSKVKYLFDSIRHEYPIGSFFLWKAGREHNELFRRSVLLDAPPVRSDDDVSFILDGQQRVTSLYATLKGLSVNGTDYGKICIDLEKEEFVYEKPDGGRYISLAALWGGGGISLIRRVSEKYAEPLERLYGTLRTYPISIVEVRGKDLPAVCRIFQRINQSGKRLDRFDLISAMTYSTDFDLRERFKADIVRRLYEKHFGGISPAVVTQVIALLKKGACTERNEFALSPEDIRERWEAVVTAVLLAADTLRKNMGVVNSSFLPYDALLTLLAYYFAKSGNRSASADHLAWLKRWFWRASFSQHYGSGGPTKMGRDRELLDQLMDGKTPKFEPAFALTSDELVRTKMTWTRSAIRNAFLCLLATREPVHLGNNAPLDLVGGGISDFTNGEKHHIFPRAYLKDNGPAGAEVHALPNFCLLPAELNRRISDAEPAVYVKELEAENSRFAEAAETHLMPLGMNSGISENDYLAFLQARSKRVLEEIGRLCGRVTTPRADERQKEIERLEHRIRDCIDKVLNNAVGVRYWKQAVPQKIRESIEQRIESDLKKAPDRRPEDFHAARAKLDYCNSTDYTMIIENKANWPHFEQIFTRQRDLQQHLEAFSEYRNVVMHSREMSELVRLGGERSIVWLENVLPNGDGGEENLAVDQEG